MSSTMNTHTHDMSSAGGGGPTIAVSDILAALRAGTPTEMADILAALDSGLPLWTARKEAADASASAASAEKPVAKEKEKEKPKAAPKPAKKEKAEMPAMPVADGAPDAASYRVESDAIDHSACVGREFDGEDKRWAPKVLREKACGAKLVDGSDLCSKCSKRQEKYAADPKAGPWTGRVTEEPLPWVHMLGTKWAADKQPKWLGLAEGLSASDSASESGSAKEEMPAKTDAKAAKEAKAAEKLAAKEAAAAEKLAAKEAAAAAKLAEKEAAAAEKLAAKEAAKEAAKAKKSAEKVKPKAKVAVAVVEAEGTGGAEAEGELELINGKMYMIRGGNVYEYNDLEEKAGDFVGRLVVTGGDKSIDTEGEEKVAEE